MSTNKDSVPATGWRGIQQHWRSDLSAAFSVALVALPLSIGIGVASGVEPMSGLIAGIIGGAVTTFFRGGHVAINGPGAGLIAVVLGAIIGMDDGSGQAINYMLAAVVVGGFLQLMLGVFRLGKLAYFFPSPVITGMLAAIGVIIISKQIHVAMGTQTEATKSITILLEALRKLPQVNPFILIISVVSLLIMIFHSRLPFRLVRALPAPIWVLVCTIPLVYVFDFFRPHELAFGGRNYPVGPELLVHIPGSFTEVLLFPNFSLINTSIFWISSFSIFLIASLETLAISKAIDKLDPYRRITNTDKDLIGNGIASMVCGLIGGLPIIPLIARSSVNIQNNAKTRWSNFYYGILLLLFVVVFTSLMQRIPLAALAAILIFTGYQLASPRVFRMVSRQGIEPLLSLLATVIITLFTDLLWGILAGILMSILIHIIRAKLPLHTFFYQAFRVKPQLIQTDEGYQLIIGGIANFLGLIIIDRYLKQIPPKSTVTIDLSNTRLVDLTVQERLRDFVRRFIDKGGNATIIGLDTHRAASSHPLSLKVNQRN